MLIGYRAVNHNCNDRAKSEGTITRRHTWWAIWPLSHSVNTGVKKTPPYVTDNMAGPSSHSVNTGVKKRPDSPFKIPWLIRTLSASILNLIQFLDRFVIVWYVCMIVMAHIFVVSFFRRQQCLCLRRKCWKDFIGRTEMQYWRSWRKDPLNSLGLGIHVYSLSNIPWKSPGKSKISPRKKKSYLFVQIRPTLILEIWKKVFFFYFTVQKKTNPNFGKACKICYFYFAIFLCRLP